MADKLTKPEILSKAVDPMLPLEEREKFALLQRTAQRDWDRLLMTPNQAVPQQFLPDLAAAIGRATRAFSAGDREY